MKKIIPLLFLMLTAAISCYCQTPQLIVSGADTFGVIPSALERNINRTYNAAHKYKDLSELCQQENDSLRSALSEKSGALKDCDQKNVIHEKLDTLNENRIRGLNKENKALKTGNFILKVVVIAESVAIYVMIFNRH